MSAAAAGAPEADLAVEAERLLAAIAAAEVPARLIGGMAIRLLLGDRLDPIFEREIADLDFICASRAGDRLTEVLVGAGYLADEQFNALNGARRLLFFDPSHGRQIDVFVGGFEMCHPLPLAERLEVRAATLPAAELLMTKLQIVELNRKDQRDAFALLDGAEVVDADRAADGSDAINASRIAALTAQDWGLQHTFELNLDRLRAALAELELDDSRRAAIADRVASLAAAMEDAPKSRRWKLRARIGERKQWYEEPEEVERDGAA
ncbi:MAG: hypothetical protein JSU06_15520 [Actinobacteria bacterium]|nr:hypothetical protein [Actinomycetota bacterium]